MQQIPAIIVQGHRVASGLNGNPRFPGGTLKMQLPLFKALGLDLSHFYLGTLNVSVAPLAYRLGAPRHQFRDVKWHPVEPPEDFSFCDVRVVLDAAEAVEGFVYYPHPETKPEHFQAPDVLELLLPWMPTFAYGNRIELQVPEAQMMFVRQ